MIHKNVKLMPFRKTSAWRKVAIGTWQKIGDPSVFGELSIDARPLQRKIREMRDSGKKITPLVIAAKAVAIALQNVPNANAYIRFGRVYHRKDINIFLQVAPSKKGDDLSGVLIQNCDKRTLEEIYEEFYEKARKIRTGEDEVLNKAKKTMECLPGIFVGPLLNFLSFILYGLNIWSPLFNTPKDGFGSAMVSSIGSLGFSGFFAPLVPYSKCPFVFTIGKISEQVVVEQGKPTICPILSIGVTADHRVVDGLEIALTLKALIKYLKLPY